MLQFVENTPTPDHSTALQTLCASHPHAYFLQSKRESGQPQASRGRLDAILFGTVFTKSPSFRCHHWNGLNRLSRTVRSNMINSTSTCFARTQSSMSSVTLTSRKAASTRCCVRENLTMADYSRKTVDLEPPPPTKCLGTQGARS